MELPCFYTMSAGTRYHHIKFHPAGTQVRAAERVGWAHKRVILHYILLWPLIEAVRKRSISGCTDSKELAQILRWSTAQLTMEMVHLGTATEAAAEDARRRRDLLILVPRVRALMPCAFSNAPHVRRRVQTHFSTSRQRNLVRLNPSVHRRRQPVQGLGLCVLPTHGVFPAIPRWPFWKECRKECRAPLVWPLSLPDLGRTQAWEYYAAEGLVRMKCRLSRADLWTEQGQGLRSRTSRRRMTTYVHRCSSLAYHASPASGKPIMRYE